MSKSTIGERRDRDRATEAFRRWARAGCPPPDQIRVDKVGHEVAEDFRACSAVFAVLEKESRRGRENTAAAEIIRAVRAVYMEEPFRKLLRQEVSHRVQAVATERYVSAREVYNWLARARRMWLMYRE